MTEPTIYTAAALLDAQSVRLISGHPAIAMQAGQVIAAGPLDEVRRVVGADCRQIDLPDHLLLPGLVNAHTHLELTASGPIEYTGSFTEWVRQVRTNDPDPTDPLGQVNQQGLGDAALQGAALCHQAGVLTVGDVMRFDSTAHAIGGQLRGVGFIEQFGLGAPYDQPALQTLAELDPQAGQMTMGVQPHAPYSAGPSLFQAAAKSGRPVLTHLAETRDELQFVAEGTGPFRALLESMGKWDDAFAAHYASGQTPVQWLAQHGGDARWLCAHCNYVTDEDIALIADRHWSVAYCPRASTYFGHTDHRYRDMLEAGVNVCLGTDSIICSSDLFILSEMRLLYQRDRVDPQTLLAMATTRGLTALGMNPAAATFTVGHQPGLVAVAYDAASATDPLGQVLGAKTAPDIKLLVSAGAAQTESGT